MYAMLVGHSGIRDVALSSLRHCNVGGAPLPAGLLQRFKALTGMTPQLGYGLTETTALIAMQIVGGEPRPGTSGLPVPHTRVEIVDLETGTKVLRIGEAGEICCSGPQVMKGWKRPAETATALEGGHFHTGDIGFLDAEGYLTLVDRKKDMIIVGGVKVFPRMIEKTLCEHSAVAEAAVIGVPDRDLGQSVKVFIELKPGHVRPSDEDFTAFLKTRVAPYEMPSTIEVRTNLSKTPVGKLSKQALLAEIEEGAASNNAGNGAVDLVTSHSDRT